MSDFNIEKLQKEIRDLYSLQQKWCDKNWQDTLKKHDRELSKLLAKVNLFDIWSHELRVDKAAGSLIPEIFMDAFISIHLSCLGLYKYANACLRSELETSLRLIYFSTHPIEFQWWCDGNEWYIGRDKNVWMEVYYRTYFEQLSPVKHFNKSLKDDKKLSKKIQTIYKLLSRYVHSGISTFQTSSTFSPKYNIMNFKKWSSNYNEIQQYVNLVITLGYDERFKGMSNDNKLRILKIGVYEKDYKLKLKDVYKIKVRGRI
jgi:hypothetical protein